jgi:hypothetical protein
MCVYMHFYVFTRHLLYTRTQHNTHISSTATCIRYFHCTFGVRHTKKRPNRRTHASANIHTQTYILQLRVADTSMVSIEADTKSDPSRVYLSAVTKGSRMCTAASCVPLTNGLPGGASLTEISVGANMSDYLFEWKPVRGQEMHEAYRVCLAARDEAFLVSNIVCYHMKVIYVYICMSVTPCTLNPTILCCLDGGLFHCENFWLSFQVICICSCVCAYIVQSVCLAARDGASLFMNIVCYNMRVIYVWERECVCVDLHAYTCMHEAFWLRILFAVVWLTWHVDYIHSNIHALAHTHISRVPILRALGRLCNLYLMLHTCIHIQVRKCQYCLQPGETLQSVAHAYKLDYLEVSTYACMSRSACLCVHVGWIIFRDDETCT